MSRKKSEQQPQLFSTYHYEWKSVQQIKARDIIVVGDDEARVSSIKHEEASMSWLITYTILSSNEKGEQVYFAHDFVYTRKEQI